MQDLITETPTHEINRLHNELTNVLRQSLEVTTRIGELLFEQKNRLKHGEWLPWLKENVSFSERTARNYLRAFHNRERIKSAIVADLNDAYEVVAAPEERLAIHPVGAIFPRDQWTVDIIESSLRDGFVLLQPIILFDGMILDGKLRYEACLRAGVEPHFETFSTDQEDVTKALYDYVWLENMVRAHYTREQIDESFKKVLASLPEAGDAPLSKEQESNRAAILYLMASKLFRRHLSEEQKAEVEAAYERFKAERNAEPSSAVPLT